MKQPYAPSSLVLTNKSLTLPLPFPPSPLCLHYPSLFLPLANWMVLVADSIWRTPLSILRPTLGTPTCPSRRFYPFLLSSWLDLTNDCFVKANCSDRTVWKTRTLHEIEWIWAHRTEQSWKLWFWGNCGKMLGTKAEKREKWCEWDVPFVPLSLISGIYYCTPVLSITLGTYWFHFFPAFEQSPIVWPRRQCLFFA